LLQAVEVAANEGNAERARTELDELGTEVEAVLRYLHAVELGESKG
jgi:hypothetical protein